MADAMFAANAQGDKQDTGGQHNPVIARRKAAGSTLLGDSKAKTPSTITVLKILEPMILPIAMSPSPLSALAMEVANSGRQVPMAIMVNPTTNSLILKWCAITLALSTTILDDSGRMINASTSHNTATVLLLSSCGSSAICSTVRLSLPSLYASRAIFSISRINPAAVADSSTPSNWLKGLSINTKPIIR